MANDSHQDLTTVEALVEAGLKPGQPVILDVRWQVGGPSLRQDYLTTHLPGAQWCDLDADLADPPGGGGRHPLPDPARLQSALRRWGIDADSEVVIYDGGPSIAAARAWWVLRWAGLEHVRVLDGGFAAWLAAGLPTQSVVVVPTPGAVIVRPGSLPSLSAEQAGRWAEAGRLVDVRAPERFPGEVEPMDPVAGRIPGALNVPTTGNIDADGRFLPQPELRDRFAGLTEQPVGVYCGSGVTAAHTMLAMRLAGVEAVLYPGSWSEWITDQQRPVATG